MEMTAAKTVEEAVAEIIRINGSLPLRPGLEEVEAAKTLIRNLEKDDQQRLEAIGKQKKETEVPEELFFILQEMQRSFFLFHSNEQKREAAKLLDFEHLHSVFDDLIQRASLCVSSPSGSGTAPPMASLGSAITNSTDSGASGFKFDDLNPSPVRSSWLFSKDDSFVKKAKSTFLGDEIRFGVSPSPRILDSTLIPATASAQYEKLSLIKLASLIELSSKNGTKDLILQNKLMDQIEWLPDSIGKLTSLLTLDLSENRIMALPSTIGGLSSLMRLDLHSNRIAELPESIGDLLNLIFLDIRGNNLSSLPPSIGRLVHLEELDMSSNRISLLPSTLGALVSLKKLNVETNDTEELPHTIGQCSSLQEIRADYNRLKALPEAVGKIDSLEILSVRYNNIRQLPTTMSSLSKLRDLDVSFNELEQVPESLCFATSLVKLNISNNFADLRFLPRSIGNLEMLEELDMSNNQIRFLPESFRLLAALRVLRVEENPLEVPPRHLAEAGAQAVVQYMAELVANKDIKKQPATQKRSWAHKCFFPVCSKRKRKNTDHVQG